MCFRLVGSKVETQGWGPGGDDCGGVGGETHADITHSSEVPAVLHTQVLAPVKKIFQRRRPAVTLLSGTEQG